MAEGEGEGQQVIHGQEGGDNWREVYLKGSEYYDNPSVADVPDIPTLTKRFIDTKALVGRKGVILPQENATPEERDQFYAALGRPEKPEGYEIAKPDNLPENFPYAPELEGQFRQWAFEEGLTAAQGKNLFNKYIQANVVGMAAQQKTLETETAAMKAELQKEWGDQYPENEAMARQAMLEFFPPGSKALAALDKVMGDDPDLLRMAYTIGRRMTEAGLVRGSATLAASLETKKQELSAHPAFLDANHVEHDRVVHEFNAVLQQIVAEEEARERKS
jgi:hypothetical protein